MESQATPPPQPPPPPPSFDTVEKEQGKGGEQRGKEGLEEQRPPSSSLPPQLEISMPVEDGGFRGGQLEEILTVKWRFFSCLANKALE